MLDFTGVEKMAVVFPYAKNYQITDDLFRQKWTELLRDHDHNGQGPDLPRLPNQKTLDEMREAGCQLSLEYLLRSLVPHASQTTTQANRPFLVANRHIIETTPERVVNPPTTRLVQGVRLLPEAFCK
jgi:hypothetical protein